MDTDGYRDGPVGPTTYSSYLRVADLLTLQQPGGAHDRLLFVVMHQSHELWFKLLLHEIDEACALVDADAHGPASDIAARMVAIVRTLIAQWDVLDTMTPRGYLAFRDELQSGSGFQSVQFREIEFASGCADPDYVDAAWLDEGERRRLRRRLEAPTLRDRFLAALQRRALTVEQVLCGEGGWELGKLAETLTDFDEAFAHWRSRHVLAVERQIGHRPGTGGSMGAEYLRATTTRRFFPELWASRTGL